MPPVAPARATKVYLTQYPNHGFEKTYRVKKLIGRIEPAIGMNIKEADVKKLIDSPGTTVIID
jgi:hypothetical protein